jgi:hypothetical protein
LRYRRIFYVFSGLALKKRGTNMLLLNLLFNLDYEIDFVMRATRAIKYEVLRLRHSIHRPPKARRYGEESKSNGMAYFAAIVARNKFPIAYSGFKPLT